MLIVTFKRCFLTSKSHLLNRYKYIFFLFQFQILSLACSTTKRTLNMNAIQIRMYIIDYPPIFFLVVVVAPTQTLYIYVHTSIARWHWMSPKFNMPVPVSRLFKIKKVYSKKIFFWIKITVRNFLKNLNLSICHFIITRLYYINNIACVKNARLSSEGVEDWRKVGPGNLSLNLSATVYSTFKFVPFSFNSSCNFFFD